jgi:hypothetical protein
MYGVDPEIANSWDGLGRCPVTPNLTEWLTKVGYYHKPYRGKVNIWTRAGGIELDKRRMLKEWRKYKRAKRAKEAKYAKSSG